RPGAARDRAGARARARARRDSPRPQARERTVRCARPREARGLRRLRAGAGCRQRDTAHAVALQRKSPAAVEKLMTIERYSHVMHLVSSLRGTLREDVDCFDALMACFPAGTVSGAPKVRAMEIIEELERTRRGIYAGGILYLDFAGN